MVGSIECNRKVETDPELVAIPKIELGLALGLEQIDICFNAIVQVAEEWSNANPKNGNNQANIQRA